MARQRTEQLGAAHRESSTTRLLQRVLDQPELLQRIRGLSPARMGELIEQVGVEDAGEIVALASSEQLTRLFDEDVWVPGAGEQEELSADRFALWLEVISEAGDETLAERLANLPVELVLLGYGKLIMVVNDDSLETMAAQLSEDGVDELDKRLDAFAQEQWQQFRVLARVERHWDIVWSSLLSLDTRHESLLRTILEHCERLSSELLEEFEDLDRVFDALDELEEAARGDRDERRAREGYVALQDARAFLRLAALEGGDEATRDPVTQAYFRELSDAPPKRKRSVGPDAQASRGSWPTRLDGLDNEAVVPGAIEAKWLFSFALADLSQTAPAIAAVRKDEVAYLVNVLMAASQPLEQQLRPVEALEVVVQILSQAVLLQLRPNTVAGGAAPWAAQLVARLPADQLFRIGWRSESNLDQWVQQWRAWLSESL